MLYFLVETQITKCMHLAELRRAVLAYNSIVMAVMIVVAAV
jgi:hypothetical protein